MRAKGTDKRGQGGAKATIVNTLTADGGGTRVEAVTDFTITGRLARFGRGGMIEDISNRLMRDFSTCLQSRIAPEPAPSGAEVPPARRRQRRSPPPRRRHRTSAAAAARAPPRPRRPPAKGGRRRPRRPGRSARQGLLADVRGALGSDQATLRARRAAVA